MIVGEGRELRREELPPLAGPPHLGNDSRDYSLIFLFRILLVQNGILLLVKSYTAEAIGAAYAGDAVVEIGRSVPTQHTKPRVVAPRPTGHTLVKEFSLVPITGIVIAILDTAYSVEDIAKILAVPHHVTVADISCFEDHITADILGMARFDVRPWLRVEKVRRLLPVMLTGAIGRKVDAVNESLVLLLRTALIKDAVLLVSQIGTAEAVPTALTVPKKEAIAAVLTEERPLKPVAMRALHAVITALRKWNVGAVHTASRLEDVFTIQAVLSIGAVEDHLTVLYAGDVVAVITVFRIERREGEDRSHKLQAAKLRKKLIMEVKFPPRRKTVPVIAPPFFPSPHRKRRFCGIHRKNRSAASRGAAQIDVNLISKAESPSESAIGAATRRRNTQTLPADPGRDPLIEVQVFLINTEGRSTFRTFGSVQMLSAPFGCFGSCPRILSANSIG